MQQGLGTAVFFTAVGLTLFWNLQWKRTMGFWLRPPYRQATEYAFRVFFALSLIGALSGLKDQLLTNPITRQNLGPTMVATAIMYFVVGADYALALRTSNRRHRDVS